jgi:hypothetical protein
MAEIRFGIIKEYLLGFENFEFFMRYFLGEIRVTELLNIERFPEIGERKQQVPDLRLTNCKFTTIERNMEIKKRN